MSSLAWGILGLGGIAQRFAEALPHSQTGRLVAVGSRTAEKAEAFGARHGVDPAHRHASYEALLADPAVAAVYIATPHPDHVVWAVRAAEAGKHILCEKPLGINAAEGMVMAEAALRHDVLLMEAYMYRCHPLTRRVTELVAQGAIGRLRHIQATFSFAAGFNPAGRLFNNALAGGGILDVGGYPVSLARLLAGAALGRPFADPIEVKGTAALHPETGIDEVAAATLRFDGGIVAQVATGVAVAQDNSARIYGTEGWIHVPWPWIPAREGGEARAILHRRGASAPEDIVITTTAWLYGLEADAVGLALAAGRRETEAMSVADTLGNLHTLDAWRRSAGLTYESEKPAAFTHTHDRRPLRRATPPDIPAAPLPGLDRPVARLVMGCDNQASMPHAAAMWDDYFARGGNAFDTAYVYGGGTQERLLGQWMRHRGVRDACVVLVKGAHTPHCNPGELRRQFNESLERLQTDRADLYCLHRDNPDVPVGEFVDALHELVAAGRLRVFGGSNWSRERVEAANAYARARGRPGFGLVSNNFSLARMVDPVWPGCIAASDPESRAWHEAHQLPLLAWSSQARGFFTERAGPDRREDAELVRCWYADDNFARRARAVELARLRGVAPINIALAYVLQQPFPTWALIGPRTLAETRTTLPGASLTLTRGECRWLNLEQDAP